jgi:hypothetical protein
MERLITKYIAENQSQLSRYEIDLTLLRAGYAPEQIETAWEQFIAVPNTKVKSEFVRKYLFAIEFWVFLVSLGLLIFALNSFLTRKSNILPTLYTPPKDNNAGIWAILCILAIIVISLWSRARRTWGYTPRKILIGAYFCLAGVCVLFSLIFVYRFFEIAGLGEYSGTYNDLDVMLLNNSYYHLVSNATWYDPDVVKYRIQLYKCDFSARNCSSVEDVTNMEAHIDETDLQRANQGYYHLDFDNVTGKIRILKASQIVYTFRST